jgi:polyphenol oxidase
MINATLLSAVGGARHAFFTRHGGVSDGDYASLNCGLGSGDAPERVYENRRRALARFGLPPAALVTGYQVHSARVAIVDAPWSDDARPQVDGLATRVPGVALGILTADCAPVLFADAEAGVIGAAHAGWRGAFDGVLEATVAAMERLGGAAGRIVAAVGPCIRQASYEVGPEFRETFVSADPATADLFIASERPDHHRFDLPGYVGHRLRPAIGAVEILAHDTCADADAFFSYRRMTLTGGGDYGRLLSAIALR